MSKLNVKGVTIVETFAEAFPMHRPDRNLVQSLAFRRKKIVGSLLARSGFFAQRVTDVPEAEIEPRPRVGRIHRFKPE